MQTYRNHSTVRDGRRGTTLTSSLHHQALLTCFTGSNTPYTTSADLCKSKPPSSHGSTMSVQKTLQPVESELELIHNTISQPTRRCRPHPRKPWKIRRVNAYGIKEAYTKRVPSLLTDFQKAEQPRLNKDIQYRICVYKRQK